MAAEAPPFTIVVGVDGSAHSRAAMDWAVEEAGLRHGSILALTAWHFPYVSDALGQSWDYEIFRADAQVILDEELDRVRGAAVPVDGRVVQGNPGAVLVEASRGADLVIVGSRGHGGFAGLLLGSVSSQTVHHAHCPVLVLREPPVLPAPA